MTVKLCVSVTQELHFLGNNRIACFIEYMQTTAATTAGRSPSSSSDDDCQWNSGVSSQDESDASDAAPFPRVEAQGCDSARDLLVFAADKAGMQAPPPVTPRAPAAAPSNATCVCAGS